MMTISKLSACRWQVVIVKTSKFVNKRGLSCCSSDSNARYDWRVTCQRQYRYVVIWKSATLLNAQMIIESIIHLNLWRNKKSYSLQIKNRFISILPRNSDANTDPFHFIEIYCNRVAKDLTLFDITRYTDAVSSPPKLHRFFRSDSHEQPGYFDNSLFCERVTRKRSKACQ